MATGKPGVREQTRGFAWYFFHQTERCFNSILCRQTMGPVCKKIVQNIKRPQVYLPKIRKPGCFIFLIQDCEDLAVKSEMEIACQTSDTIVFLPRVLSQSGFSLLCLAALTSKFQKISEKIIVYSFYDCITGMLSEENACPEQGIELPKKLGLCNQGTRDL